MKEYALWGKKNGIEDIIRVNGEEVQKDYTKAKKIKEILNKRGEFENIRIQTINLNQNNFKNDWIKTVKRGK